MKRVGMSKEMVWLLIIIAFVVFGGGIIAFLILQTGESLSFCDWWDQFTPNIPLIGDRIGLECPFPE